MDRRKLLFAPIILASLSIHKRVEAKVSSIVAVKNFFRGKKEIQLGDQNSYMAQAGKTFVLPMNPKHGETYRFSVDCKSLESPCRIIDKNNYAIVGDKEPFVLNMLSIFSLKFNAITKNWEIS